MGITHLYKTMKTIILATIAALALGGIFLSQGAPRLLSQPQDAAWTQWKMQFGRTYGTSAEESYRKGVFVDNYNLVQTSNENPEHTFVLKLNKFGDLTGEEFKAQYTGLKKAGLRSHNAKPYTGVKGIVADVDWTQLGGVNAVKDQGACGSCWAFSAICAMEFADFQAGTLHDLSEQQLVDCDTIDSGCNGGLMDYAFTYAQSHGIYTTAGYGSYTARGGSCKSSSATGHKYTPTGYTDVTARSQDALVGAIKDRVVSVAVEADRSAWQFYSSGILNSSACGTQLDHGVAAVGVNTDQGFYKVRNSWGASWGESGYIRLALNGDGYGICGVQSQPSYPN